MEVIQHVHYTLVYTRVQLSILELIKDFMKFSLCLDFPIIVFNRYNLYKAKQAGISGNHS